jgi:hypothetical protein
MRASRSFIGNTIDFMVARTRTGITFTMLRRARDRCPGARGCAQGWSNVRGNRAPLLLCHRCQILWNGTIKPLVRSWPQWLDRIYLICYKELMAGTGGTLRGVLRHHELNFSATIADMIDRASVEDDSSRRRPTNGQMGTSLGGSRSTRACRRSATRPVLTSCSNSGTRLNRTTGLHAGT